MADKDLVFKGKIKQKGIYDYKALYEFLYDYMSDEGYNLHEDLYGEELSGEIKNVQISWKAEKTISDYITFEIKLFWIILGQKKVKLKTEEGEVSMDSGTPEIAFTATIIKDPEGKWGKGIMKSLRKFYDDYIFKDTLEDYEVQLFEEVNEIISATKSYLAIEGQHTI